MYTIDNWEKKSAFVGIILRHNHDPLSKKYVIKIQYLPYINRVQMIFRMNH